MCHSRSLAYTCHHTIPFRLSTCRGTFPTDTTTITTTNANQSKRPTTTTTTTSRLPRAACHSSPSLTLHSPQPCGRCQCAAVEEQHAQRLAVVLRAAGPHATSSSWMTTPPPSPPELQEATEAEFAEYSYRLSRRFPDREGKSARPWEQGPRRVLGLSSTMRGTGCGSPLRWEVLPGDKDLGVEIEEVEAEKRREEVVGCEGLGAGEVVGWTKGDSSQDVGWDGEGVEGADEEAVLAPTSTITAAAEMTTMTAVEQLPDELAGTLASTRNAENAKPSALPAPERRRQPKTSSTRRSRARSDCDHDDTESKWGCFPSWLMVSS
ncbi:hypothetical protein B0A55_03747 [Friedmanniomyces simplex]|uniref:Uncharacterized protein n=1 Tax=Friedmanniomyces simplex TaxID=329884 RepID=A0A4U0XDN8_9PEZI|nr:hypothetical protein B0A55_03747 [Friedmanniomyces simplex]